MENNDPCAECDLVGEVDRLKERLAAANAGRPLGPVIGAQGIVEEAGKVSVLRKALKDLGKELTGLFNEEFNASRTIFETYLRDKLRRVLDKIRKTLKDTE